ncbi:HAD family hydrolase [Nocardioides sp. JQ2195]|uniref:HAD family hydrolase n=1 Tax=Nocardioides sp. JQ2195 TaxID=2592334 RepID=UPI00143EF397|nr:HAD family hydrolase [Nocardioides sp. JQ2195]QIX28162.1 HAD family hydrolase [Nocardioides sp. JQ2195]
MIRAVLFDLDDTLFDHTTAARSAVVRWALERGVSGEEEALSTRWRTVSDRHYRRYQARELTYEEQGRERVREFLAQHVDDAEADEAFNAYRTHYRTDWRAFADARPAIERLHEDGVVVGVLTNGAREQQALKIERVGLADLRMPLFASSDFPAGKPDPRPFLVACGTLGLPPEQVTMVGDSVPIDVEGALAAGLAAVLLDRFDAHPDHDGDRVRSLDDLLI